MKLIKIIMIFSLLLFAQSGLAAAQKSSNKVQAFKQCVASCQARQRSCYANSRKSSKNAQCARSASVCVRRCQRYLN